MSTTRNLYEVLGVEKNASQQQIKQAYRQLAMKVHPDRVSDTDKEEANRKFSEISAAYEILSDEEKRRLYDHDTYYEKLDSDQGIDMFWNQASFVFRDPFEVFEQVFGREYGNSFPSNEFSDPFYVALHDLGNSSNNQTVEQDPNASSKFQSKGFLFTSSSVVNSGGKTFVSTTRVQNGQKTSRREVIYPDGRRDITTNNNGKVVHYSDGKQENITGDSNRDSNQNNFDDDPPPSACGIFCRICCLICCPCCRSIF